MGPSEHETEAPVAFKFVEKKSKTDENKREGGQTVALKLYAETNLEGATVTRDALNNNKPQAQATTQAGGHNFLQLKTKVADRLAKRGGFFLTEELNTTYGRFDRRSIEVGPLRAARSKSARMP